MRFSKNTGCFYPNSIEYTELPADLINVPKEDFDCAMKRGPGDTLDIINGRVVVIPKPAATIAEVKAVKWDGIKAERDRRQLSGGVKVGQHWFLSTERATSEYNTIISTTRGIPDTTIVRAGWRTMDGAEVDMTPALALQILTAGIAQRCVIDDVAQAHKAAMEVSADPTSYDFSGGWPATFAG